jgi:hypothetical protein
VTVPARILFPALAVALLLALGAATPASANHSRGKCKARGDTIVKNDSGRVYEREEDAEVTTLYGCLWSTNREVELQSSSGDGFTVNEGYAEVLLRGHFVAWVFTREDISCKADCPPNYDPTQEYVNVFNLKARKGDFETSDPAFGSLRLNSTGAAAWLTTPSSGGSEVNVWDGAGWRSLGSGQIRRFRLRGRMLSWLDGDVPRSYKTQGAAVR